MVALLIVVGAVCFWGFKSGDSRSFQIAKNLDIFNSIVKELDMFLSSHVLNMKISKIIWKRPSLTVKIWFINMSSLILFFSLLRKKRKAVAMN